MLLHAKGDLFLEPSGSDLFKANLAEWRRRRKVVIRGDCEWILK
jgi:hypothetical protein